MPREKEREPRRGRGIETTTTTASTAVSRYSPHHGGENAGNPSGRGSPSTGKSPVISDATRIASRGRAPNRIHSTDVAKSPSQ